MFFSAERQHFFKPLTSKYREQIAQCLCLLYQRQYSSTADYGSSLSREQTAEILEEALVRAPVLDSDTGEDENRFKNNREHANWILKQLVDCGWLEKQVDTATLHTTYPFSRMGRKFTQTLVESDSAQIRTRHRNTRNTLNSLEAFLNRHEVHDLIDAFESSERIITDFTDIISELEERKRQLVREVESQQLVQQATDQFFEFMEKRFQPDVSVRLSADSVEKHRDQIQRAINRIRRKNTDSKRTIERQLRRLVPELAEPGQSVLWMMLDTIEKRMSNAAETKLPALRRSLHGFTKRADIIIRQLSYLSSRQNNDLLNIFEHLQSLPADAFNEKLERAATHMSGYRLQLIDPAQIKLQERRSPQQVVTAVQEESSVDHEVQRDIYIQQMLDQAFTTNNEAIKSYVLKALYNGSKVLSTSLPIDAATDLLAFANVIEIGAVNNLSSDYRFIVEPSQNAERRHQTTYFEHFDEFIIEVSKSENT